MSEITKPIMLDETGKKIIEALNRISRHAATADMASDSEKLGGKEPSAYLGTGDVPEWAKQPNKPTYTASEVGALPSDGKAVDSDKLNGHPASDFSTTATVTALADDLTREISRAKETEEVLKSRIDTITSLPEGSTTGDAELQDIRVKADGTIAENAGNAVREQFSELKGDLDDLDSIIFCKNFVGNEANVKYRIPTLRYKEYFSMSTSDGSTLLETVQINFYDKDMVYLDMYKFYKDTSERLAIYVNPTTAGACFIELCSVPSVPIQIEKGEQKTAYVPHYDVPIKYFERNDFEISVIKDRIDNLLEDVKPTFPDYYNEHIENKINDINNVFKNGNVLDSFIFMTDNHIDLGTDYAIPLMKYICDKTAVRFNVFGGDIITHLTKQQAIDVINGFYKQTRHLNNFYPIIGNHEYNDPSANDEQNRLSNDLAIGLTIDKFESNYTSGNELTYRVDNHKRKITYFFVGCRIDGYVTDSDIEWILSQFNTLGDGYSVVVFSHPSINIANNLYFTGNMDKIADGLRALKSKTSYTFNDISYNYSSKNVDVIGIIGGHVHKDLVFPYYNIIAVSTTCQSYRYDECGGLARTQGTITESAFDVVVIDKTEKRIYMFRIGAGTDRVIDYDSSSSTFGLIN